MGLINKGPSITVTIPGVYIMWKSQFGSIDVKSTPSSYQTESESSYGTKGQVSLTYQSIHNKYQTIFDQANNRY